MPRVITLVLLTALGGCGRSNDAPSAPPPATDAKPLLSVYGCDGAPFEAGVSAELSVDGTLGSQRYGCYLFPDGGLKVRFIASPKATLTVGDLRLTVSDGGEVSVPVDADATLLRAPTEQLLGAGAKVPGPLTIKLSLTAGAKPPLEGDLVIGFEKAAQERTRALLRQVATGATLPLADLGAPPPPVATGSMVFVPSGTERMQLVGPRATLAELDLVAIERDGASHTAPTGCGPYLDIGTAEQQYVEVDVDVFEVRSGKKLQTLHVDHDYAGCPTTVFTRPGEKLTVQTRPSSATVTTLLGEVTAARVRG